jgi:integrase/recombinase XerD
VFITWCAGQELDPLALGRQLELYVRWLQEVRRFKPSTVSRRTSVVAGFYRTWVIDGVLARSRRPLTAAGMADRRLTPVASTASRQAC